MTTPRQQTRNANRHTQRGMAALSSSIEADGWIGAITLAADGESFDGSARIEVSDNLDDAIVVRSDGTRPILHIREDIPSADDPRAVRLGVAANRVAQLNLEWDSELLAGIGDELDLSGLWNDDEWAALIVEDRPIGAGGDEFDTTPNDGPTRVQPGELWRLGEHRLLCGDSTKRDDVARLMQGERAALVVTSPPYGVGKDYEDGGVDEWRNLIRSCFDNMQHVAPLWFVNLANRRTGNDGYEVHTFGMMANDFEAMGYSMIALRIWLKDPAWAGQMPIWHQTYKPVDDFEFLGLFASDKPTHKKRLSDADGTAWGYRGVWEMPSVRVNDVHSAVFPVELPARAMRMLTDSGDLVIDPFMGSGTTIISAEQHGRIARGIERSPAYCDVILRRWEAETGKQAERID